MDPIERIFVDANDEYARLVELDISDLRGLNVLKLFAAERSSSIKAMLDSFARGTLEAVRGEGPLQKLNGEVILLRGWSRRIDGIGSGPLVVTSAVEVSSKIVPDERPWLAIAPQVFGLPEGWSGASRENAERRAVQLEQHLWRIGLEARAAGLLPELGHPIPDEIVRGYQQLSARQRDVVARLAAGSRVAEIARDLYLTPSTVRNHLTAVFKKFGVHSQVELIALLKGVSDYPS
jgi:DNA-binding CsgD family transcriptional regulator